LSDIIARSGTGSLPGLLPGTNWLSVLGPW
jgi:hypothetical protein